MCVTSVSEERVGALDAQLQRRQQRLPADRRGDVLVDRRTARRSVEEVVGAPRARRPLDQAGSRSACGSCPGRARWRSGRGPFVDSMFMPRSDDDVLLERRERLAGSATA